jgi:hypothetical protein
MSSIQIGSARVVMTYGGVQYQHDHTINVAINNPRQNNLDASPQDVGSGFSYQTGIDQPVTATLTLRHLSSDLTSLLKNVYKNSGRLDLLIYDAVTLAQYTMDECIVQNDPRNKSIGEGNEVFNVDLSLQCTYNNFDDDAGTEEA